MTFIFSVCIVSVPQHTWEVRRLVGVPTCVCPGTCLVDQSSLKFTYLCWLRAYATPTRRESVLNMWSSRIKFRSSGVVTSAFTHRTILPVPTVFFSFYETGSWYCIPNAISNDIAPNYHLPASASQVMKVSWAVATQAFIPSTGETVRSMN